MSSKFNFIADTYLKGKVIRSFGGTLNECLREFELAKDDEKYDDYNLYVVCKKNNQIRKYRSPKTELWKLNISKEVNNP